jgi:CheY-like chemotaxis protein
VRLDSAPGAGSRFVVTLPVSSVYAGEAPVPRRRSPSARGTPRTGRIAPVVLLVEDNEANVVTVRGYLESQGYEVRVARDGMAAVEAAVAPEVALVLMDVQLPRLDGLEATRRIRNHEHEHRGGLPARPIVALTAYAMPGDEERCRAAGATTYLAKPVRLRELVDTIERLIAPAPGAAP